jgi:hypothetical protein
MPLHATVDAVRQAMSIYASSDVHVEGQTFGVVTAVESAS